MGNHVCPALTFVCDTAVTRTTVSPQRTVTAPSASFANFPVSMTMGVWPTLAVTVFVLIYLLLYYIVLPPPFGESSFWLLKPLLP